MTVAPKRPKFRSQLQEATRAYSTASSLPRSSFSYTLNVDSVETLRTLDINTLNIPACRGHPDSSYDAVLLVSTNLTTILDHASPFLGSLFNHIFPSGRVVSLLAAVVDQVPSTQIDDSGKPWVAGREGFSLLYGPQDLGILPQHEVPSKRDDGPGFLTFTKTLSKSSPFSAGFLGPNFSNRPHRVGLQVPLSKTLFQNGKLYTSFISNWSCKRAYAGTKLSPSDKIIDYTPSVHLPDTKDASEMTAEIEDFIDLTPIQYIGESKGNIIRETVDKDGSKSPASQLLQDRVNQIHAQHGPNVTSLRIYAAVFPKDSQPERFDDPRGRRRPLQGAKYFRVSGGGGEWGAKAGLLALECKSSYTEPVGDESDAMIMASLLGQDPMSTLDFFEPGLPIKFVGRLKLKEPDSDTKKISEMISPPQNTNSCCVFSAAQELEESSFTHAQSQFEPKGQENLFGACAAEAMAYGVIENGRSYLSQSVPSTLLPIGTVVSVK